ncbi:hypothetical protein WJ977_05055 [Achromobacter xylosoxidans]
MRRLPPQHRQEVLDELQARSQSGTARNVVAYFFALVKRVFYGRVPPVGRSQRDVYRESAYNSATHRSPPGTDCATGIA